MEISRCEFLKNTYLSSTLDNLFKELSDETSSATSSEERDDIIAEFFQENRQLASLGISSFEELSQYLNSDGGDEIFKAYNQAKDDYLSELNDLDEVFYENMSLEEFEDEFSEGDYDIVNAAEVYQMVDLDSDGKLNADELQQFRDTLAEMNGENVQSGQGASGVSAVGAQQAASATNPYNAGDNSGLNGAGDIDTTNPQTMSIEQLQAQKTTLEGEISTLGGEVSTCETQLTTDSDALTQARALEQGAKADMDSSNQEMLEAIQNDENITEEQRTQLGEIEDNIASNASAISENQQNILNLETAIATAETEISAFNVSISEKNDQISSLSGTISQFRSQLNVVEGDDETAVSQRQTLKSQIDSKNSELQQLKTALDADIAAKQAKEQEKAELESQLQTARSEQDNLNATEADLLKQKTELLNQFIENVTPETKALIEAYQASQKAYQDAKVEVKTCETNLDATRTKLNEANANLNAKQTELAEVTSILAQKETDKAKAVSDTGEVEIPDFIPDTDAKFIRQLHPDMQAKVVEFYQAAKDAGLEFAIQVEGQVRTLTQQEKYKASNPNRYGTPNPFGTSSMHLMGLAIDITPINGSYAELGAVGKSVGLTWGGDFKSNGSIEQHHFQFDTPIETIYDQYGKGTDAADAAIAELYPCFKSFGTDKAYGESEFFTLAELRSKGYA